MRFLDILLSGFQRMNVEQPITLSSVEEREFFFEIFVENGAMFGGETIRSVSQFFGGLPVQIEQIPGTQRSVIRVSKVEIPRKYEAMDTMKYVESNSDKGLFVGIGNFGPVFVKLDGFRHGFIAGGSGYGKSQFMRQLVAQSIAFHGDVVNHIVDPKQVDFKAFSGLPGTGKICYNEEEWNSLFTALILELSVRKLFFNRSFKNPPNSLAQYNEFRKEAGRTDPSRPDYLPEFPRLITWIDEAAVLVPKDVDVSTASYCLEYLVRQGRSFGIHIMFSTQRTIDLPPRLMSQAFAAFLFYTNDINLSSVHPGGINPNSSEFKVPGIEGRVFAAFSETGRGEMAQVPLITMEDASAMAKHFASSRPATENAGFYKLAVDPDLLNAGWMTSLIMSGKGVEEAALAVEKAIVANQPPPYYRTGGRFRFVYRDIYEPIDYVYEEEETFDDISEDIPVRRKTPEQVDEEVPETVDILRVSDVVARTGSAIAIETPNSQGELVPVASFARSSQYSNSSNSAGPAANVLAQEQKPSVASASTESRGTASSAFSDLDRVLEEARKKLRASGMTLKTVDREEKDEEPASLRGISDASASSRKPAGAAPEDEREEASGLVLPDFLLTDNMPNREELMSDFLGRYEKANDGVLWCCRDIRENDGMVLVRDYFEAKRKAELAKNDGGRSLGVDSLVLPIEICELLARHVRLVSAALASGKKPPLLVIYGPSGMGKLTIANRVANSLGLAPVVNGGTKTSSKPTASIADGVGTALGTASREDGAATKPVQGSDENVEKRQVPGAFYIFKTPNAALARQENVSDKSPNCLVIDADCEDSSSLFRTDKTKAAADFMSYGTVIEIDSDFYMENGVAARLLKAIVAEVAETMRVDAGSFAPDGQAVGTILKASSLFSPSTICDLAATALTLKDIEPQRPLVTIFEDMARSIAASKKRSAEDDSAEIFDPTVGIDDIKLGGDVKRKLEEIIFRARRAKEYAAGKPIQPYLAKNGLGTRVTALFFGPPGTGKTMAASVIAKEIGSKVWKVSLQQCLSKWVGESEKNIARIFAVASAIDAVLLLDEADALLGARNRGEQQHDRRLVNQILMLIEKFKGCAILTTNLNDALDPALARRCDYSVEFATPDKDTMVDILRVLLTDVPGAEKLDLPTALGELNVSGGYLKNAVERAVLRLDRSGREAISQEDIESALREVGFEVEESKGERRQIGLGL